MSKNTGGPAFPRSGANWTGQDNSARGNDASIGMTLRDYFAANAMKAILADALRSGFGNEKEHALPIAQASYTMADAMLAAREAE